jgi:hypothetical protein
MVEIESVLNGKMIFYLYLSLLIMFYALKRNSVNWKLQDG